MNSQQPEIDVEKTIAVTAETGSSLGQVDRYKIIRRLGSGGFGAVFLAQDNVAGVLIALKALPPEIAAVPEELENVRSNFALVSKLHHHNIAGLLYLHRIEQVDELASQIMKVYSGSYLVVMEYIEGLTLNEWQKLFHQKKVPFEDALRIARQVAEALDYAHRQKILHRDVKPANIMVQKDDTVKVLDFGLAYEIHSSMSRVSMERGKTSAGTPNYMSPEQWAGSRLSIACDQYALACMFYEFISGSVPFASAFSTNDFRVMMNVVETKYCDPLPELSAAQNAALKKAMEKSPDKRFDCCIDFINALQGKKSGLGRGKIIGGAIGAAVLLIVLVAALFSGGKDKKSSKTDVPKLSVSKQPPTATKTIQPEPVKIVKKPKLVTPSPAPAKPEPQQKLKSKPEPESKPKPKPKPRPTAKVIAIKESAPRKKEINYPPNSGLDWTVPDINIKMVWIKAGKIVIRRINKSPITVGSPDGFWISSTEITIGQFIPFLRNTQMTSAVDWKSPQCPLKMRGRTPELSGNKFGNSLNQPMTCVTGKGAVIFCRWLSRRETKADRLPQDYAYFLPGLDLLKYAFLAGGKKNRMSVSEMYKLATPKFCWSKANSGGAPRPVATSQPNALGIYDLVGNVYEFGVELDHAETGIRQQRPRMKFIVFGASWDSELKYGSQLAFKYSADKTSPQVGFRVVLAPKPKFNNRQPRDNRDNDFKWRRRPQKRFQKH